MSYAETLLEDLVRRRRELELPANAEVVGSALIVVAVALLDVRDELETIRVVLESNE